MHHGALRMLRDTVPGVPKLSMKHVDTCKRCVLGKFEKETISRSNTRSSGVLQLIHSNICGPLSTKSLRGYDYFVIFIIDYSTKT